MTIIIPRNTTWNLTPLGKSDHDQKFEQERKQTHELAYKFINKWKTNKQYLENPKVLKEALDEYEYLARQGGKEAYYFHLRTSQDENSPELKAKANKIIEFYQKIQNDILFFTLNLSKISKEKQEVFMHSPELKPYKHFLYKTFEFAKYTLTESEEKIMSLKSQPAYSNWVRMVSGALTKEEHELNIKGKKEIKNFSQIQKLISDIDKKTRDTAAQAFNDILKKHVDEAESEINSILLNKKIDDELRHVKRPDTMRHLSDDIETEVVDMLIDTVSKHFTISQRYYKLKAKLMKVKQLEYHERNVPYGKISKEYSYEEAIKIVEKAFKNLNPEFYEIFKRMIENGQVDVYPYKNKTSGAFCTNVSKVLPTYILLNHVGELRDVTTIAHEFGHAINIELIKENENALNVETPLSTTETASTFMEDFVFQELLKETDDELKLALMLKKLDDDISSIIRQIACYKFEQELHQSFRQKGYLSKDDIGKLFQKHMSSYMGEAVKLSPGSENWWVYWSHIRNFFYVYSYSSGLLISKSLQASVKKDHKFIEKVKKFLSTGVSESPKEIFKELGIDITKKDFWLQGLNEMEQLLQDTERLAKKLGKI